MYMYIYIRVYVCVGASESVLNGQTYWITYDNVRVISYFTQIKFVVNTLMD